MKSFKTATETIPSLLPLFLLFIVHACNDTTAHTKKTEAVKMIYLQPFNDVSKAQTDRMYQELKKFYTAIEVKSPIALPRAAYYAPRNRYKADSLIHFLKGHTAGNNVTIGITNKDISTTKGPHADFGIMGLAYRPGKACVVSSYRLTKGNKPEEFFKVAIHELGHTQGLPHCPVTTCFMRDAAGGNPLREEKGFCEKCKAVLVSKGWKL